MPPAHPTHPFTPCDPDTQPALFHPRPYPNPQPGPRAGELILYSAVVYHTFLHIVYTMSILGMRELTIMLSDPFAHGRNAIPTSRYMDSVLVKTSRHACAHEERPDAQQDPGFQNAHQTFEALGTKDGEQELTFNHVARRVGFYHGLKEWERRTVTKAAGGGFSSSFQNLMEQSIHMTPKPAPTAMSPSTTVNGSADHRFSGLTTSIHLQSSSRERSQRRGSEGASARADSRRDNAYAYASCRRGSAQASASPRGSGSIDVSESSKSLSIAEGSVADERGESEREAAQKSARHSASADDADDAVDDEGSLLPEESSSFSAVRRGEFAKAASSWDADNVFFSHHHVDESSTDLRRKSVTERHIKYTP